MKVILLMLVALSFVFVTACGTIYGPVKESQALMEARDDMVTQWSKIIKASPDDAGIAEARKYFESKKADLIAKRDAVKNAPQGFNSDWRTNLFTHEMRTGKELDAISNQIAVGPSYASAEKFKPLRKEFEDAYR
ncbi:MAG: hypothetical protein ABI791_09180 [Acidobacteriota bacterium]